MVYLSFTPQGEKVPKKNRRKRARYTYPMILGSQRAMSGQKVVKVFNHEGENLEGFRALNEDLRASGTGAQAYASTMVPATVAISYTNYAVVAVVGAALAIGGHMGVGSLAATVGLALKFVSIPLSMLTLGVVGSTGASGMDMLAGTGVGILVICILLVFFGGALFAWSACRTVFAGHDRPLIGSTLCALALVLAGEVLSRLMFYGSYLRIGL